MFKRATRDFEKSVSKKGSRKKKVEHQRDEKALGELTDMCCLYDWVMSETAPRLRKVLTQSQLERFTELFYKGSALSLEHAPHPTLAAKAVRHCRGRGGPWGPCVRCCCRAPLGGQPRRSVLTRAPRPNQGNSCKCIDSVQTNNCGTCALIEMIG